MQATVRLDEIDIIHPQRYVTHGYPHEAWTLLRQHAPVYWFDRTEGEHFWAITKHADICFIGKRPDLFSSEPLIAIDTSPLSERRLYQKNLSQVDPPEHRIQRSLISHRFTPHALKARHGDIERIAQRVVNSFVAKGDERECDFVDQVAAPMPIGMIGLLLGVPEADWDKLLHWTHRLVGSHDPEYQDRPSARETSGAARQELYEYFQHLLALRRRDPKDDLMSLFAHAELDGQRLSAPEVLVWMNLMVVSGNEATRNAIAGGMLALIEHEHALCRVQAAPALIKPMVDEILRWTSPVVHFARTATRDVELRGQKVRKGDHLALFYPSANRDEEVFDDPWEFRVDRRPNPHVAFGAGEHYCIGAHLASLELECLFRILLPRIEHVELSGEPQRLFSSILGGIKHLPVRYKLKPA